MQSDRLKLLAERYLQSTCDELLLLRAQVPQAQAGQAAALLEMQRIAHGIHGSGAMLGFQRISEHAGQIERILRRAELRPTTDEWQLILMHLQGIDTQLAQPEQRIDT